MLATIKHQDVGSLVVVAKLLTGYNKITEKVSDPDSYIKVNGIFDAQFVAHIVSWQGNHGVTADGIIGPDTWRSIAAAAPTCSTSKNRISGYTMALQILLDSNLTCDAIYGSRTKSAVVVYQDAKGLKKDGICGLKTWNALIVGTSPSPTPGKVINNCVHYLQWDSRWKNVKYSTHTSKQTIGNSGCGPTAMAQIMATWVDKNITPVQMAKLSVDNGFRTYDSGTSWGFFKFVFEQYPTAFAKFVVTKSIQTLEAALANGALAVCSMNSNDNGFWTKGG